MKIKEILTEKELHDCQKWGMLMNVDDIEYHLHNHMADMEIKDFLLMRIQDELNNIYNVMERKANAEGY